MSIKGAFQTSRVNDYGYTSLKVGGVWYGADKKGSLPVAVNEGDVVEFDAFDKPGKNGKSYPTFQYTTFKKVSAAPAGTKVDKGPTASKDEYWAAKEANDAAKEPRINYFASLDRAIAFTALALANGAVALPAKAAGKLEALEAIVYETTQRFVREAYAQGAAAAPVAEEIDESTAGADAAEGEGDWE